MKFRAQLKLFVLPGALLALALAVMFVIQRAYLLQDNYYYDKVMHTMGGSGACALVLWIIVNLKPEWMSEVLRFGLPMIGRMSGLFFGIDWEMVEAIFPIITEYVPQGQWDTGFDLLFDYVGGHIAGKIYERRRHKFGGE